jgi:altronate dehydratase small subunit
MRMLSAMKIDAIQLKEKDNVATALRNLAACEEAVVGILEETKKVSLGEAIPNGHKFAVKNIRKGQDILKYGEVIGRATAAIAAGNHAHVQNIESLRGRGDLERKEG